MIDNYPTNLLIAFGMIAASSALLIGHSLRHARRPSPRLPVLWGVLLYLADLIGRIGGMLWPVLAAAHLLIVSGAGASIHPILLLVGAVALAVVGMALTRLAQIAVENLIRQMTNLPLQPWFPAKRRSERSP